MRIYRKRAGTWALDFRENGKRRRVEIGSKEDAERELKKRKAEYTLQKRGRAGMVSNRVPLSVVRDSWIQATQNRCKASTVGFYEANLDTILNALPAQSVEQITSAAVESFISARRAAGIAPRTINMSTSTLKSMLAWAADNGLIASNPLRTMKPVRGAIVHQRRALTADECAALLAASPECYRRIWLFMLGTGFRRGEVQGLKWEQVDLERGEVRLRDQKNGTDTTSPLPEAVLSMLRELRKATPQGQVHVFENAAGRPWTVNLLRRLRSCLKAAGIVVKDDRGRLIADPTCDLHSLRVTFITHLLRAGVDLKSVQTLARHKTVALTLNIYARSWAADRKEGVERLTFLQSGQKAGTENDKAQRKSIA